MINIFLWLKRLFIWLDGRMNVVDVRLYVVEYYVMVLGVELLKDWEMIEVGIMVWVRLVSMRIWVR